MDSFERLDRSRFQIDAAAWARAIKFSAGFEPVSVVTADGDLSPKEFLRLAESLRASG